MSDPTEAHFKRPWFCFFCLNEHWTESELKACRASFAEELRKMTPEQIMEALNSTNVKFVKDG